MNSYERKRNLYREYRKELSSISGLPYDEEDSDLHFENYLNSSDCKWINIPGDDEDIFSGFIIIGKNYPEKHIDSDYAVDEAYLDPKYRGNKLCRKTFESYLKEHSGVWSLIVYKDHPYAEKYWDSIFSENGYQRISLKTSDKLENEFRCTVLGYKIGGN